MPVNFNQRLSDIGRKARIITDRYRLVVGQRDEALTRVEDLTRQVADCRKTIESLRTELNYLRVASNVSVTQDSAEDTRRFLSELVWEIDKCIAQLSE